MNQDIPSTSESLAAEGSGSPRLLLISLSRDLDNASLKILHSSALHHGFSSTLLFYTSTAEAFDDRICEFVFQQGINVVGISVMSIQFPKAARLSLALKRAVGAHVNIVWGGVHPTIDPESARPYADYVCVGEADSSLPDFLRQWRSPADPVDVPGFNRTDSPLGTVCASPADLDTAWHPDHFPSNAYVTHQAGIWPLNPKLFRRYARYDGSQLSVVTSRGCPYSCAYCCNDLLAKTFGHKIRKRSARNVIQEIADGVRDCGVYLNYINIIDDCFLVHSEEWFAEFVALYQQHRWRTPIYFRAIPGFVQGRKLAVLSQIPCGCAMVGLQSGSERILAEVYRRKQTNAQLLEKVRLLDECRIPIFLDVIVNNPYETEADWKETIDVVSRLPRNSALLYYSLTFYRHTSLYERAKADGVDVDAHLTKDQNETVDFACREVNALRLAHLFGRGFALGFLRASRPVSKGLYRIAAWFARAIVEPLHLLRLAFISQQRRAWRFLRLLLTFGLEFAHNKLMGRHSNEAGGKLPTDCETQHEDCRR